MPNTLASLNSLLDIQLRDTTDTTWTSAEKDTLLTRAVAELYSYGILTTLDPWQYTEGLIEGTYIYDLDPDIRALSRVDLVDSAGQERGPLLPGTWEVFGDITEGEGDIHISPTVVDEFSGGSVRFVAYGVYDVTNHLIPDKLVSPVLAHARAEAYRRVTGDRARFKQLQKSGPIADTTVNDLMQMVNEADREAQIGLSRSKTLRKPVPARI